jgi:hypothetical protein
VRTDPLQYAVEPGLMGAIGEYESLMLRVNRNCPWNRCLFCPVYKDHKFGTRGARELKRDIDAVSRTRDLIAQAAHGAGAEWMITRRLLYDVIERNPLIYGASGAGRSPEQRMALHCLSQTAGWLSHGSRRVFLQDADALAMKIPDLVETLEYLKRSFPSVETVTCYARSRSCARRSAEDLAALGRAGLSWCFVGVESGWDAVLETMNKGVTRKEHIETGRKLRQAGIHLAAFVMPGLAGRDPSRSRTHVLDTVAVLNEMRPGEVRVRSLAVLRYAPLYRLWESGEFDPPTEDSLVEEIRSLLEGIDFECTIETLQMTNPVVSIKGPISVEREPALERLASYQALAPGDRALFTLGRYLGGGYLRYVEQLGGMDAELESLIDRAWSSAQSGASDALPLAERAIFAMKSRGVP